VFSNSPGHVSFCHLAYPRTVALEGILVLKQPGLELLVRLSEFVLPLEE
jgi:hypothetical protein